VLFDGRRSSQRIEAERHRMAQSRKAKKVTCEQCFFRCNMLCALELDEPCGTFRPDSPEGLRPPPQMQFVFRRDAGRRPAWAFPSAEEQAALRT
jgi:hypothetical protein